MLLDVIGHQIQQCLHFKPFKKWDNLYYRSILINDVRTISMIFLCKQYLNNGMFTQLILWFCNIPHIPFFYHLVGLLLCYATVSCWVLLFFHFCLLFVNGASHTPYSVSVYRKFSIISSFTWLVVLTAFSPVISIFMSIF